MLALIAVPGRARHRTGGRGANGDGQSLVEFALILPMFVALLMGVIEFSFVFNAMLSVNYSARDAALAGAEAGNLVGADCVIIKAVEAAVGAPASDLRIQTVEIYSADPDGDMIGSPTVYTRGDVPNAATCAGIDGSTIPYARTQNGYAETGRCNFLAGCVTGGSVDTIAVRVTYSHRWVTPLPNFIGGGAGTLTFHRTSVMRMEPVL
jgi:Flp pilus assembly protein TadG